MSSKSPFWLQLGSRETPHTSPPETGTERCLRRNEGRATRAAWVLCAPFTPRRVLRTEELARSSRRRVQPFLPNHCCSEHSRACLPGLLWSSSREEATRSVQAARWARTHYHSRSPNLAADSSAFQPRRSLRGSEAEPTTSSRYSSLRGRERSLDLERLRRAVRYSRTNSASPFGLRRRLGIWLEES